MKITTSGWFSPTQDHNKVTPEQLWLLVPVGLVRAQWPVASTVENNIGQSSIDTFGRQIWKWLLTFTMTYSINHNFPSIPKEFPQRTCIRSEISVRLSHLVQYENAIPSPHTHTHTPGCNVSVPKEDRNIYGTVE